MSQERTHESISKEINSLHLKLDLLKNELNVAQVSILSNHNRKDGHMLSIEILAMKRRYMT
jgi:hypothetical protein